MATVQRCALVASVSVLWCCYIYLTPRPHDVNYKFNFKLMIFKFTRDSPRHEVATILTSLARGKI